MVCVGGKDLWCVLGRTDLYHSLVERTCMFWIEPTCMFGRIDLCVG